MPERGGIREDFRRSGTDETDAGERWQLFAISMAGSIACFVIGLLSYVPAVAPVPVLVWGLLLAGSVLMCVATAILKHKTERQRGNVEVNAYLRLLVNGMAWWLRLVIVLAIAFMVTGVLQMGGWPRIVHGAYYLSNHGKLTRVSHFTYLRAASAMARLFCGWAFLFYSIAAARALPGDAPPGPSRPVEDLPPLLPPP
jgi:hypothetical protein